MLEKRWTKRILLRADRKKDEEEDHEKLFGPNKRSIWEGRNRKVAGKFLGTGRNGKNRTHEPIIACKC